MEREYESSHIYGGVISYSSMGGKGEVVVGREYIYMYWTSSQTINIYCNISFYHNQYCNTTIYCFQD
jgi:hypothetical protein